MGFFAKEQQSLEALVPLTHDMIKAALDARGDHYSVDEDGDIGGYWDSCLYYFFQYGQDKEILHIRGRWWGKLTPAQFDQALRACNDHNVSKIWPKAYVRQGDDEVVRVYTEVSVDYEHGLTPKQLGQQIKCALATSGRLFESLNETFPDEAAAAKVEFES